MPVFRNMIKLAGAQIFTKIGLNNEALIE
jgi:hypothetical protein